MRVLPYTNHKIALPDPLKGSSTARDLGMLDYNRGIHQYGQRTKFCAKKTEGYSHYFSETLKRNNYALRSRHGSF